MKQLHSQKGLCNSESFPHSCYSFCVTAFNYYFEIHTNKEFYKIMLTQNLCGSELLKLGIHVLTTSKRTVTAYHNIRW
jgi:hypothetical protein